MMEISQFQFSNYTTVTKLWEFTNRHIHQQMQWKSQEEACPVGATWFLTTVPFRNLHWGKRCFNKGCCSEKLNGLCSSPSSRGQFSSKWIKEMIVRPETLKLKGNICKALQDVGTGKASLKKILISRVDKGLHKIKGLCTAKKTSTRMKG